MLPVEAAADVGSAWNGLVWSSARLGGLAIGKVVVGLTIGLELSGWLGRFSDVGLTVFRTGGG